jgi:hypothetical protein
MQNSMQENTEHSASPIMRMLLSCIIFNAGKDDEPSLAAVCRVVDFSFALYVVFLQQRVLTCRVPAPRRECCLTNHVLCACAAQGAALVWPPFPRVREEKDAVRIVRELADEGNSIAKIAFMTRLTESVVREALSLLTPSDKVTPHPNRVTRPTGKGGDGTIESRIAAGG